MPSPELQRVHELWFSDSGLVIQAEQSLFRVSGAVLGAQSTFFRDMLLVPQPLNEPSVEGCPVVHLPDSATDVTYFLKAIFNSDFFERPPAQTKCEVVAGILRLSTKYDVDYLRKRCLLHLETLCPDSLESFETYRQTSTIVLQSNMSFFLLELSQELDLPWLQPVLMYFAATRRIELLLDGAPWSGSEPLLLDPSSQRACLIGRSRLTNLQNKIMVGCFTTPCPQECSLPKFCSNGSLSHLRSIAGSKVLAPLHFPEIGPEWHNFSGNVCSACLAQFEVNIAEARQKVWDALPGLFNLPTWKELRDLRAAALK